MKTQKNNAKKEKLAPLKGINEVFIGLMITIFSLFFLLITALIVIDCYDCRNFQFYTILLFIIFEVISVYLILDGASKYE